MGECQGDENRGLCRPVRLAIHGCPVFQVSRVVALPGAGLVAVPPQGAGVAGDPVPRVRDRAGIAVGAGAVRGIAAGTPDRSGGHVLKRIWNEHSATEYLPRRAMALCRKTGMVSR